MTGFDDIEAEAAKALTALYENWRTPPAELIFQLPKAGRMLDYLGHAEVTRALIESDPFWEWEPMGVTEDGLPAVDVAGGLWIKLTVHGVTRIGYGDPNNDPKQLISDAIKNAAMRFGVALSLWSKAEWDEKAAPPAQRTTSPGGSRNTAPNPGPSPAEQIAAAFEGATVENEDDTALYDQSPFDDSASTAKSPAGGTEPPPRPAPAGTITEPQVRKINVMLKNLGVTSDADRHEVVGNIIGVEVESMNQLDKKQASTIIDSLGKLTADDFVEVNGNIRLA